MKKNYYIHNGVEAINLIQELGVLEPFAAGNVIKYHFRRGKKNEIDELENVIISIIENKGSLLITKDNLKNILGEIKLITQDDDLKKAQYYYNILNSDLQQQLKDSLNRIGIPFSESQ